jgi:hypothetical protein
MRLIILILTIALMGGGCNFNRHSQPSEKVRFASEIRSKVAKKLRDEMDLIPFGFGGRMMYQIKRLNLAFQYRHPIDIEGGRELLMQAANVFLEEVNTNEKIRPYLDIYPFEPKNIKIIVSLQDSDGRNVSDGELALITFRDGVLQYKFNDLNSSFYRVVEETYEEALEIIQNSGKLDRAL